MQILLFIVCFLLNLIHLIPRPYQFPFRIRKLKPFGYLIAILRGRVDFAAFDLGAVDPLRWLTPDLLTIIYSCYYFQEII